MISERIRIARVVTQHDAETLAVQISADVPGVGTRVRPLGNALRRRHTWRGEATKTAVIGGRMTFTISADDIR